MPEFITVAKISEIAPGEGQIVQAGAREIALFNVDGNFHAIDNICVHRGGPLGAGELEGMVVTCPWHAWTYNVTTGKCMFNSAVRVEKYDTRIENDQIQVAVAEP